MQDKDVKIGMKVVPFQKTAGCRIELSDYRNHEFMYVCRKVKGESYYGLSSNKDFIGKIRGDFFNPADFEPFVEKPSYAELVKQVAELSDKVNSLSCQQAKPQLGEVTLEDCLNFNNPDGSMDYFAQTVRSPNKTISDKVLLYGLLQSVAWKLNDGKTGSWTILINDESNLKTMQVSTEYCDILFATRELANQAISIFAKSQFDLKKLFS